MAFNDPFALAGLPLPGDHSPDDIPAVCAHCYSVAVATEVRGEDLCAGCAAKVPHEDGCPGLSCTGWQGDRLCGCSHHEAAL